MRYGPAVPITVAVLAAASVVGCGASDNVVPVAGVLTHKGSPVSSVRVTFTPEKGQGRPSSGTTDEQGRFRLLYDRQTHGAEIGAHIVSVEYVPKTDAERQAIDIHGKPPPISKELKSLLEKYGPGNSKHKVQIEARTRELKLDLD